MHEALGPSLGDHLGCLQKECQALLIAVQAGENLFMSHNFEVDLTKSSVSLTFYLKPKSSESQTKRESKLNRNSEYLPGQIE